MTQAEFMDWVEYREKRGTLHMGLRLEAGFALIATSINRAMGGKAEMEDFMPHMGREASIEDVMGILSGKG